MWGGGFANQPTHYKIAQLSWALIQHGDKVAKYASN